MARIAQGAARPRDALAARATANRERGHGYVTCARVPRWSMWRAQAIVAQSRWMSALRGSRSIGRAGCVATEAGLRRAIPAHGPSVSGRAFCQDRVLLDRVQWCACAQPASVANSSEARIVVIGETLDDDSITAAVSAARWTRRRGSP